MVSTFIELFVPHKSNDHHPYAIRLPALVGYVVFLLVINLVGSPLLHLLVPQIRAASVSTSALISLTNSERSATGLNTLTLSGALTTAATNKANDMFAKQYWSHYGPNGETPWQFINGAGYAYKYAGENLAKDFGSAGAIHSAWMASATHRANILKAEYFHVGVAAVSGTFEGNETIIVVQMFGTPAGETLPETAPEPEAQDASDQPVATSPGTSSGTGSGSKPSGSGSEPIELKSPTITEPESGSVLNDLRVHVKGNSNDGDKVLLRDRGQDLAETPVVEAVFDYPPEQDWEEGEHSMSAVAQDSSGAQSPESESTAFEIDSVPPEIGAADIEVTDVVFHTDNTVEFDVRVGVLGAPERVDLDIYDYTGTLASVADDVFGDRVRMSTDIVRASGGGARITAVDRAGNSAEHNFDIGEQLGLVLGSGTDKSIFQSLSDFLVLRLGGLSFIGRIDVLVLLFLISLFVVDIVVLWKMKVNRHSSHSLINVLLLVLVIGVITLLGTHGSIL